MSHLELNGIIGQSTEIKNVFSVEQGLFREDLFYRLFVIPLHLPPLRERTAEGIQHATEVTEYEKALILQSLEKSKWVKNKATKLLHLSRTTWLKKSSDTNLHLRMPARTRETRCCCRLA